MIPSMSCSVSINCPGYSGRKLRASLHGDAEKRLDERSAITGLFWHREHSKCRLSTHDSCLLPPFSFRLLATSVLSSTRTLSAPEYRSPGIAPELDIPCFFSHTGARWRSLSPPHHFFHLSFLLSLPDIKTLQFLPKLLLRRCDIPSYLPVSITQKLLH